MTIRRGLRAAAILGLTCSLPAPAGAFQATQTPTPILSQVPASALQQVEVLGSDESVAELEARAAGNDRQAMLGLGNKHRYGLGAPVNAAEAARWYRMAVDRGDPQAMVELSLMSLNGLGVEKDIDQGRRLRDQAYALSKGGAEGLVYGAFACGGPGVTWIPEADEEDVGPRYACEGPDPRPVLARARAGDRHAMVRLAELYSNGAYLWGMEKDDAEAFHWLQAAARKGEKSAYGPLAEAYAFGKGVEKDDKAAFTFYLKAARDGVGEAMDRVAVLYHEGRGVRRDSGRADHWCKKAARTLGVERVQSGGGLTLHIFPRMPECTRA